MSENELFLIKVNLDDSGFFLGLIVFKLEFRSFSFLSIPFSSKIMQTRELG
jgi:hypothetical protein